MNRIKKWWYQFNLLACPKCGCKDTVYQVQDRIDHTVCEESIHCARCNRQVNYWAYGSYQEPTTKTELLGWYWVHFKWWVERKFKRKGRGF